ncbi:MAG: hypothetical protein GOV15_04090, partial [Candidatus Diapherotrites archaeon]|nr:hypothetical protein [Candidatus Diapherotrites archaeon]
MRQVDFFKNPALLDSLVERFVKVPIDIENPPLGDFEKVGELYLKAVERSKLSPSWLSIFGGVAKSLPEKEFLNLVEKGSVKILEWVMRPKSHDLLWSEEERSLVDPEDIVGSLKKVPFKTAFDFVLNYRDFSKVRTVEEFNKAFDEVKGGVAELVAAVGRDDIALKLIKHKANYLTQSNIHALKQFADGMREITFKKLTGESKDDALKVLNGSKFDLYVDIYMEYLDKFKEKGFSDKDVERFVSEDVKVLLNLFERDSKDLYDGIEKVIDIYTWDKGDFPTGAFEKIRQAVLRDVDRFDKEHEAWFELVTTILKPDLLKFEPDHKDFDQGVFDNILLPLKRKSKSPAQIEKALTATRAKLEKKGKSKEEIEAALSSARAKMTGGSAELSLEGKSKKAKEFYFNNLMKLVGTFGGSAASVLNLYKWARPKTPEDFSIVASGKPKLIEKYFRETVYKKIDESVKAHGIKGVDPRSILSKASFVDLLKQGTVLRLFDTKQIGGRAAFLSMFAKHPEMLIHHDNFPKYLY